MSINERQAAKERIAKLLNMTTMRGASESEALSAAKKAGKLMSFYDIEINEIGIGDSSCVSNTCRMQRFGAWNIGTSLAVYIAKFCDCKVWRNWSEEYEDGKKQPEFTFFGFSQDVEFAVYFMEMLSATIKSDCEAFSRSKECLENGNHPQSNKRSFMIGMESRLRDRIIKLTKEKKETVRDATGTSLVPVKQEKIKEEFDDLGIKLRNTRGHRPRVNSQSAYKAGRKAGKNVSLGRGVKTRKKGVIGSG